MKLIPNSQSWSEYPRPSLWLFLFENGCTNISNLCTTPIATCPSCRAVHYKYSCWVSPHMHRLTASCCLWHTALHWHHLHLHAVENSPDRHCFCSFSHKSIAVGQQMPPSHLQVHTPTCTMPLLKQMPGQVSRWTHILPRACMANAETPKHQRQSWGRNPIPVSQQKQSLPWSVPREPEFHLIPGFIASLEQGGTILQYHSNVPQGLLNFYWCLKISQAVAPGTTASHSSEKERLPPASWYPAPGTAHHGMQKILQTFPLLVTCPRPPSPTSSRSQCKQLPSPRLGKLFY